MLLRCLRDAMYSRICRVVCGGEGLRACVQVIGFYVRELGGCCGISALDRLRVARSVALGMLTCVTAGGRA